MDGLLVILPRASKSSNPASWSGHPQDHVSQNGFLLGRFRSFCWLTTMSYTPRIRFNLDHGGLVQIMFLSFHGWLFTFHVNLPGCVFLLGQYIPTDSVLGAFFQNSQVPASMDKLCKYATPLTVSKKKSAARGSFTIPTSFCDSWVVTETFLYLL